MSHSSGSTVLHLQSIGMSYQTRDGARQVLHDISLGVEPGEVVALVGPSGSGKSTLLGIAGLLQAPSSGTVLVSGTDASGLSPSEQARLRAARIGFLFQEPTLTVHLTALENVLLPLLADRKKAGAEVARGLLGRLGLTEHADKLPGALSGGQAQRVAIGRALVRSPGLILADEPTASLDAASADNVRHLLRGVAASGVGVLVTTHDPATVAFADRTLALDFGTLTPVATPHRATPASSRGTAGLEHEGPRQP